MSAKTEIHLTNSFSLEKAESLLNNSEVVALEANTTWRDTSLIASHEVEELTTQRQDYDIYRILRLAAVMYALGQHDADICDCGREMSGPLCNVCDNDE